MKMNNQSKIMKVLFKIFKAHFVFVDFCILEAVFYFIHRDLSPHCLKHPQYILRHQIAFSELAILTFSGPTGRINTEVPLPLFLAE